MQVDRDAVRALQAGEERPRFELLHRPQTNILCFRHVPARLRGDEPAISAHNERLHRELNRSGRAFVTSTLLDGWRVLRLTFINPRTELEHVERVLGMLEELAGATAV